MRWLVPTHSAGTGHHCLQVAFAGPPEIGRLDRGSQSIRALLERIKNGATGLEALAYMRIE